MRQNLLESAWIGPPLELNGRELKLSPGKHDLLKLWRNAFFSKNPDPDETTIHAMGEMVMVLHAVKTELKALRKMTDAERSEAVTDFLIEYEDEFGAIQKGLEDRMGAFAASMVESESPGKGEPVHAS